MKKLLLAIFTVTAFSAQAQDPQEVWETGTDVDGVSVRVTEFRRDGNGIMYTTGHTTGDVSGDLDIFVSVNDADGNEIFTDIYDSGAGSDEAFDIRVDQSGNVYVIGNCRGGTSLFLRKYNSSGVVQWTNTYHGAIVTTTANHAAFRSSTGDTYITGRLTNAVSGEGANLLLIKYLSDGSIDWEISYDDGNGNGDYGYLVTVDGSGNAYVLGERNVVGAGTPILRKYSNSGVYQWSATPSTDGDVGGELKMETNSNVAVYGWTQKQRYAASNGVLNETVNFDNTVQLFTSSLNYHLLSDGGYVRVDPNGVRRYNSSGTQLAFNSSSSTFYSTIMSGDDKLYVLPIPTTSEWKVRKYDVSTTSVGSSWIYVYGENMGFGGFRLTENNTITMSSGGSDLLYLHRICLPPEVEITVDPADLTLCPGETMVVSANAEYASTFDWWGQGATASASSSYYWPGGGGISNYDAINLSVTVDAGNGCVFDVNIPTVQGARYIDNFILDAGGNCLDDPGYLQAISAGNSYQQMWFFNDVQQNSFSNIPQYQLTQGNGTYGLVTFDVVTACASADTFELEVNDLLPTEDASFVYGSNTYAQNQGNPVPNITGISGGTFTETTGNVVFANSTTGEIDLMASTAGGPYTITYTSPGICAGEETFEITITSIPTGISSVNKDFGFYPNPASTVLNLRGTFTSVSVHSSTGQLLKQVMDNQLDVADLVKGVYLLRVENNDGVSWHRFIKD